MPANLTLLGDSVTLGPGFQGGAITNLTLAGETLAKPLPVTGTRTAINNEVATNLTVGKRRGARCPGHITLRKPHRWGKRRLVQREQRHRLWLRNRSSWRNNGCGRLSLSALYSPLTNAGTITLTAPITFDGATNGILNEPGGLMNLGSNASITISTPTNYFINQGAIFVQNAGAGATNAISYQVNTFIQVATNFSIEIAIYEPFLF